MSQAIHFIAIGGSAMHSLALALQKQGYIVTGSDDVIYDPSRTQLQKHGLLPAELGWFPEKVNQADMVIVGMHARPDNPELLRAQELGLPIYSYPDFIYQQSQQKQRVVITGSHGKTTVTAMILHVMQYHNRLFDFLVGEPVAGLPGTVRLSAGPNGLVAPVVIIEGDDVYSSPIDPTPKFLNYKPHIALINGIAWDHVNLYPTWDAYVEPFEQLAEDMPKAGILIFDESDNMLDVIGQKDRTDITKIPYQAHPSEVVDGQTYLITKKRSGVPSRRIPVSVFGEHNMKNIAGAMAVCDRLGLTEDQFYEAIPSFVGVTQRMEKIAESDRRTILRDAAHAPAKVEAVTEAVRKQYAQQRLLAVVELHTYSSLSKSFLGEYEGTLNPADSAVVYVNSNGHPVEITASDVNEAFAHKNLRVFTDIAELQTYLIDQRSTADVFLLMSSGSFGGIDINELASQLLG
ncbi:UDP-N-acetylmuramate--L-alanine ligase [Spirosoma sp. KUDC1026]|uniref:UDP-N-acetylmuramate--L-alanine ligase n=1 Tax=Spirosoma sp. KUDC1026 TaxID=2745947 RepID=UPI00159B8D76|nr:Mur ligase family protein [Spirosoma sp. KUDC1026]QKZ11645.1 peptidoglycan synthetase [Spirosoma sp. KUDC1026]